MRRGLVVGVLLQLLAADVSCVIVPAEPGKMLEGIDDGQSSEPPFGIGFLRAVQPDCRRCLKECLGAKVQAAQITAMKIQAPLGLMTWYLFKNRPFKMYPLEDFLAQLVSLPPALFAGVAGAAYFSCRNHCEMDCPYPGVDAVGADDTPALPEIDAVVDASDTRFLQQLYRRGGGRGGGGSGSFAGALSDMFRVV